MSDTESGSFYSTRFARGMAAALCLIGVVVLGWWLKDGIQAGLNDTDWNALDARTKLAGAITVPVVVFGGVTLLVGVWMAAVEWRGLFKTPTTTLTTMNTDGVDPGKIIEALGKLKGAALVMVVGGLLLLGATWVAQSAAQPPPTPAPSTAGPTGN
jgi:hypothetical protein